MDYRFILLFFILASSIFEMEPIFYESKSPAIWIVTLCAFLAHGGYHAAIAEGREKYLKDHLVKYDPGFDKDEDNKWRNFISGTAGLVIMGGVFYALYLLIIRP